MTEHEKVDWTKPIECAYQGGVVRYVGPQEKDAEGQPALEFRHLLLVGAEMRAVYVDDCGCTKGEKGRLKQYVRNVLEKKPEPSKAATDSPVLEAIRKVSDDLTATFSAVSDLAEETEKVGDRLTTVTGHLSKMIAPRLDGLQKTVEAVRDGTGQPLAKLSTTMDAISADCSKSLSVLTALDKAVRDELISFKIDQKRIGQETIKAVSKVDEAIRNLPSSLGRSFDGMKSNLHDMLEAAKAGLERSNSSMMQQVLKDWAEVDISRHSELILRIRDSFEKGDKIWTEQMRGMADAIRALGGGNDIDRRLKTLETDTRARLDTIQTTLDLLLDQQGGGEPSIASVPDAVEDTQATVCSVPDAEPSGPVAHYVPHHRPIATVHSMRDLGQAVALQAAPDLEVDERADEKIVLNTSTGRIRDLGDDLLQRLRWLASYAAVTKIQFGSMAMTRPDRRKVGQLRLKKELNGTGFCLRGYDVNGIRDVFVYCTDPASKAAVLGMIEQ